VSTSQPFRLNRFANCESEGLSLGTITVCVDSVLGKVLSDGFPQRGFQAGRMAIRSTKSTRLEELLSMLGIPWGLMGFAVRERRILSKDAVVGPGDEIHLFAIYDGG